MMNIEKAREISAQYDHMGIAEDAALEMAEWKDQQHSLERSSLYRNGLDTGEKFAKMKFEVDLKTRLREYKKSIHAEIDAYDYGYMDALKEMIEKIFED